MASVDRIDSFIMSVFDMSLKVLPVFGILAFLCMSIPFDVPRLFSILLKSLLNSEGNSDRLVWVASCSSTSGEWCDVDLEVYE